MLLAQSGFHLENSPNKAGKTGGIWILRGCMMVKDVTKFHKCHLGDQDMLEYVCVCVCVCAGFHSGF